MLDQQGSVAKLAKVDATEHPGLASRFDVTGYPTLKIFRRGSAFEFKGGRTASEITEYLTKQAEPAVKRYSNKLMSHAQPFLVLFSGDEPTKLMFERLAEALRDEYEFADSNSPDDFGATAGSIVLLKPNFSELDQSRVVFSTGLSASDHEANKKAVVEFMNKHAYPLVTDTMDGGKYKQDATWESALRKRGYPMVLLFVDSTEGSDSSQQEMKDALAVANAHLGEFSFVRLDGLRDSERLVSFGLTKRLPQVVLEDGSEHYGMEGSKIDQESLSKFIADFKAGSLTRSIRSEEPPSSNNEPVTVVVGKTFDTIVKDDRKNVMIEFYAPWCGHCQQLAPTYEKLGAKYKANDSVVVAKMDASANEVPDSSYKVEGFPTLLFKPAGAASPLEYQGDRELDALAKFIDQNSK